MSTKFGKNIISVLTNHMERKSVGLSHLSTMSMKENVLILGNPKTASPILTKKAFIHPPILTKVAFIHPRIL